MQFDGKRVFAAALLAAAAGSAGAVTMFVGASATASVPGATPGREPAFQADAPAPPRHAAAPARPMEREPSPYALLLLGAGVMALAGSGARQDTPWAPSTVE
jgi:hypothetical protein